MAIRHKARVKFYHNDKRFGFLRPFDVQAPDAWVCGDDLEACGLDTLIPDQLVEFEFGDHTKGRKKAIRIKVVL